MEPGRPGFSRGTKRRIKMKTKSRKRGNERESARERDKKWLARKINGTAQLSPAVLGFAKSDRAPGKKERGYTGARARAKSRAQVQHGLKRLWRERKRGAGGRPIAGGTEE